MIFDRIKTIANAKNISLAQLEKEIGLNTNYLYRLKNQIPKSDKLLLIADYLDVSIDYLLGRDEFINRQNTYISGDNKGVAGGISGGSVTINHNAAEVTTKNTLDDTVDLQKDSKTLLETDEIVQAKILLLLERHTEIFEAILEEIKKEPR